MTVLTFSSLFVAAIVVVGAVYFTLRHVGLQEADDPSESRPQDLTEYERQHVHRADVR